MEEFQQLLAQTLTAEERNLVSDYVNGRLEVARRARTSLPNAGALAVEANHKVSSNQSLYAGKSVLRALRAGFRQQHGRNMKTDAPSELLRDDFLATVASKVPKRRA